MAFIETPRFPERISLLALAGPAHSTDVVELASGHEQRNVNWDQARCRYQIQMPLVGAHKDDYLAWRRAMRGQGHGFRLKDWTDYQVPRANGRLAEIVAGVATLAASDNGTGVPTYQLAKTYTVGTLADHRWIRKPIASGLIVYRGGSAAVLGGAPGQYAVSTITGIVTWVTNASNSVTAVTPGATTAVTLSSTIGLAIGGRLYLTGTTGTIAAALNNLSHPVTNIVGNVHTLSTNTSGLVYGGCGVGARYPQPTEALEWEGTFDVPVRFGEDEAPLTVEGQDIYRGQSLTLVEIRG